MIDIITRRDGQARGEAYAARLRALRDALEGTWRGDRYLRAFHDDGTEIRSGDKDIGAAARIAKEGGKHWVGEVLYDGRGKRV